MKTNPVDGGAQIEVIACDMSAIPAAERNAHVTLARTLLSSGVSAVRETATGLVIEVPSERLGDVAKFVDNERTCCPHLAFAIEVPPHRANLLFRVGGPGAREELSALAR